MFDFNRKEKGQGLVEYALILVLIAIVVIVAMTTLGSKVSGTFDSVNSGLGADGSGGSSSPTAAPTAAASHTAWCNYYHLSSGSTIGGYPNDIVLMTTSGGFTATLWADDPAMTTPGSEYYNPTIIDSLSAGETYECP